MPAALRSNAYGIPAETAADYMFAPAEAAKKPSFTVELLIERLWWWRILFEHSERSLPTLSPSGRPLQPLIEWRARLRGMPPAKQFRLLDHWRRAEIVIRAKKLHGYAPAYEWAGTPDDGNIVEFPSANTSPARLMTKRQMAARARAARPRKVDEADLEAHLNRRAAERAGLLDLAGVRIDVTRPSEYLRQIEELAEAHRQKFDVKVVKDSKNRNPYLAQKNWPALFSDVELIDLEMLVGGPRRPDAEKLRNARRRLKEAVSDARLVALWEKQVYHR